MTDFELLIMAKKACEMAYSPYSKIKVGAALLCGDGTVFSGCNVENSSYGATICAERTAFTKAISEGHRDFVKIAVASNSGKTMFPCGICLQFMSEFSSDLTVILEKNGEAFSYKLTELFPFAFKI